MSRGFVLTGLYALPCLIVWHWYHYVFWPAVLPPDSIDQWYQALSGSYYDWHPAFHSMLLAPFARLGMSPALVVSIHIWALALLVGRSVALMDQAGLKRSLTIPLALFMAIVPANGSSLVVLLKDSTYCVAFVGLMVVLLEAVITGGASLTRLGSLVGLTLGALLVALVRHNGPPVAFGTLLALPFVFRSCRKQLAICLLVAAGIWCGVKGPLFSAIGVVPAASTMSLMPLLHQIGAHLNGGTPLTQPEKDLVQRVHPLDDGKWPYDPYSHDPLLFSTRLNANSLREDGDAIRDLSVSLVARNPRTSLRHASAVASTALKIFQPEGSPYRMTGFHVENRRLYRVDPDNRLKASERDWALKEITRTPPPFMLGALDTTVSWLLWRPALPMYLMLGATIVASIRWRSVTPLVLGIPIMIQTAVLAIVCPSQEFRYQWPVFLCGWLLSPYLLFGRPPGVVQGRE